MILLESRRETIEEGRKPLSKIVKAQSTNAQTLILNGVPNGAVLFALYPLNFDAFQPKKEASAASGVSKEFSPVFTQWLDAIWQIMRQRPCG